MVQTPVKELESLRGKPFIVNSASAAAANQKLASVQCETCEIEAEVEPDGASEIGFRLRKGAASETLVGVTSATNTLFLDRTKSGDVSFSKDFPGRFSTTLSNTTRVKLHIFVDRSSVEVFANDGEKVMTDRIYPPPGSTGIEIYATGTGGQIVSLTVWPLKSVWGDQK